MPALCPFSSDVSRRCLGLKANVRNAEMKGQPEGKSNGNLGVPEASYRGFW